MKDKNDIGETIAETIAETVYGCFLLVCCVVSGAFVLCCVGFVSYVFNWGNR